MQSPAQAKVRPPCWTCSARIFLSFRWTRNASGFATTICLPNCCAHACTRSRRTRCMNSTCALLYGANRMGRPVEAVQHALAAQAWDRAAHLLEAHEHDWWTGSDLSMMNLLPHLPDEVVLRGPNLIGLQGVVSPDQRTAAKRLHAARYREGSTCRGTESRRAPGPAQLCGHAASLYRRAYRRAPGHSRSIPLPCPTFRKIAAACATAPR